MCFMIEESDETITTHSGLSLIGLLLNRTHLGSRLNKATLPGIGTPDVSNRNVPYSYLGLLCQGKSEFDYIEPFHEDDFFSTALEIADGIPMKW